MAPIDLRVLRIIPANRTVTATLGGLPWPRAVPQTVGVLLKGYEIIGERKKSRRRRR